MNEFEKEFDDEVYEDSFYGEEEELVDEEEKELEGSDSKKDSSSDSEEIEVVKVDVSFACDDCDYRWDDVVLRRKDEYDDDSDGVICPMCGSMNVTQI